MTIKQTLLASLATTLLFFSCPVFADERLKCGEASYYPSEYTCHNNDGGGRTPTLCPTVYGLPTKPCGNSGGCYAPEQFSCDSTKEDGVLRDLPETSSPFVLRTYGLRTAYRNQTIRACGGYLAIGANARECHACTAAGGKDCGQFKNATVFLPDGRMNSAVPFHQYWYVNPQDGLLQYTPAVTTAPPSNNGTSPGAGWNATVPTPDIPYREFAGVNVKVYENGFFVWEKEGTSSHFWFACLVTLPGGAVSTGRSWRIYAPLISDRGCELVKIAATSVDKSFGVYKYV
ncbi:hypothetical protein QBC43DRAFT_352737 [Cladorrhinum sp. PSN259]|nr:hypothetical protein QBC43DRAFT_352737 [Cladorrhinum sp. PSN259]